RCQGHVAQDGGDSVAVGTGSPLPPLPRPGPSLPVLDPAPKHTLAPSSHRSGPRSKGEGSGDAAPNWQITAAPVNSLAKVKTSLPQKFWGLWFNVKDKYRFITQNDTTENVFGHQTAVKKNNPKKYLCNVGDGETVEFERVTGPGGVPMQGSKHAPNYPRPRRCCPLHTYQRDGAQSQQPSKAGTAQNTDQSTCKQKPLPVFAGPKRISHTPLTAFLQSLLPPCLPPNLPFSHSQNKDTSGLSQLSSLIANPVHQAKANPVLFLSQPCAPSPCPSFGHSHPLSPLALCLNPTSVTPPCPLVIGL
uniref:CSD domain-containing protein n=1 Tax=Catharus ustulatus TaxID=91951 RepID=A0A8C3XXR8_CATUS